MLPGKHRGTEETEGHRESGEYGIQQGPRWGGVEKEGGYLEVEQIEAIRHRIGCIDHFGDRAV
jgi:hypothetical protein